MKKLLFIVLVFVLAVLTATTVLAGGRPLTASLNGANEVGAAGDPDGSGTMNLTLNSGQEEICWNLEVANIDAPTRAHIHEAPAGQNGGVVVFFFDLVVDPPIPVPASLSGCVTADRDLIKEIRANPEEYYINVHNDEYPAGAVRGQLSN